MSNSESNTAGRTSSWRYAPSRARRLRKALREGLAYWAGWGVAHAWLTASQAIHRFGRGIDDRAEEEPERQP